MKKRFWKWLRNWLDSAGCWLEGAALWIEINKCAKHRVDPEHIDNTFNLANWRPVPMKPLEEEVTTHFVVPTDWKEMAEKAGYRPNVCFPVPDWMCTCKVRSQVAPDCPVHTRLPPLAPSTHPDCTCLRTHDSYPFEWEIDEACPIHGTTADPRTIPPKGH